MLDFGLFIGDTYAWLLAAVLLAAFVYLCLYYGLFHMRVGLWRVESGERRVENEALPPVSVVLTARNDAAWLKENLVYLLEQDYPNFEVVVVDYLSHDDTQFVLKLLKDYYPHLKIVPFKEDVNLFQGKKYPLSIGIKSAKNDILMLADPDCTPKNFHWLRGMVRGYSDKRINGYSDNPIIRQSDNPTIRQADNPIIRQSDNPTIRQADNPIIRQSDNPTIRQADNPIIRQSDNPKIRKSENQGIQIVLGYCGVKRTKTLLGCLQQYDALAYGAQYLGSALLGHPYTGSGRNLSYRRSFFFKQGAFIRHYDVADGSDDLFVYQNGDKHNTAVCIDADACLAAEPKKHFYQWHDERRHRVATRNRHSLGDRLRESLPTHANVLFYAAAVLMATHFSAHPAMLAIPGLFLILKWAWQIVCFSLLTKRFDGGYVHFAAPLLEIYFIIANTILILLPLPNNRKFKK